MCFIPRKPRELQLVVLIVVLGRDLGILPLGVFICSVLKQLVFLSDSKTCMLKGVVARVVRELVAEALGDGLKGSVVEVVSDVFWSGKVLGCITPFEERSPFEFLYQEAYGFGDSSVKVSEE